MTPHLQSPQHCGHTRSVGHARQPWKKQTLAYWLENHRGTINTFSPTPEATGHVDDRHAGHPFPKTFRDQNKKPPG